MWRENGWRDLTCPACKTTSLMPKRLDANPPFKPRERYALYQCEACDTLHYPDAEVFRYESRKDADLARKFYLEVGAGLDAMIAPLAWAGMEGVSSYLEVGGGYGFSVDFATRELGWKAANIDPSFLARTGADDLGHRHVAAYLSPDHEFANQSFDRVLSSEVIEHVDDPDAFVETLTAALAPGGVLLLTTPNAAVVKAGASRELLLPVVTAGHHLIIFSEAGLRAVLKRAGYTAIHIRQSGPTLYAAASRQTVSADFEARPDRQQLQNYLAGRLDELGNDPTLFSGFAAKLMKEFVHTGQWNKAEEIRDQIAERWRSDYGFDLMKPVGVRPEYIRAERGQRRRIRKFAANYPFSLAIVLYYSGRIELEAGRTGQAIEAFHSASRTAIVFGHVFESLFAACRETEDAGIRSLLAAAELEAPSFPAKAVTSLLSIAECQANERRDDWQRVACQVFAAGALSGRIPDVEPLMPTVRGWLDEKHQLGQALNAFEGYAAGGLGEAARSASRDEEAVEWFQRAAGAMPDEGEATVFTQRAHTIASQAAFIGRKFIKALNNQDHETANRFGSKLLKLDPEDPQVSESLAFALGIYCLNMEPDAEASAKWFMRAAELSDGEVQLKAEYHLALAVERLPPKERGTILPDLIRKLRHDAPENGDLGSQIRALADRYDTKTGLKGASA